MSSQTRHFAVRVLKTCDRILRATGQRSNRLSIQPPYRLACRIALTVAGAACLLPAAFAQSAHFNGALSVISNAFHLPASLAVDSSGNLYVADSQAKVVIKIPWSGSAYGAPSQIGSGLAEPTGVAVDSSGNVYIADQSLNEIIKVPWTGTSYGSQTTIGNGFSSPKGVAVDSSGNVYVADCGNSRVVEIQWTGSSYGSVSGVGAGFSQPVGIAVDAGKNLYIPDLGLNQVIEIPWTGSSYGSQISLGSGLAAPSGVAVDSSGNVYIGDTGNYRILELPWTGSSFGAQMRLGTLSVGQGLAVDVAGNVYVADSLFDGGQPNHPSVYRIQQTAGSFESVKVGTTSGIVSVSFTFDSSGMLNNRTPYQVLTQGATGLDFNDAGTGSCATNDTSHNYNAGDTCTVDVILTPTAVGLRQGAVVLYSASGSIMAIGYLSGSGTGPQVAFLPGMQSTILPGTPSIAGMALDAAGDFYGSDSANSQVVKWSGSGYGTEVVIASSLVAAGLAVDGAGNVFAADTAGNRVLEVPWTGTTYGAPATLVSGLSAPEGLAIDGGGNLYIADSGNNRVLRLPWTGSNYGTQATLGSGLSAPFSVAADALGNIYIGDKNNSRVVREAWNGVSFGAQSVVASSIGNPIGVAVSAGGQIFIASQSASPLYEVPWTGSAWGAPIAIPVTGFSNAVALTVDGAGNLYISNNGRSGSGTSPIKVDLVDAPSLSFADTAMGSTSSDSPKTVTVQNIGNTTLQFPVPSTGTNPSIAVGFKLDGATTCPQETPLSTQNGLLAQGTTCTLAVDFTPAAVGPDSGSLVLSDNSLNANNPYTFQLISLSGTGLAAPTVTSGSNQTTAYSASAQNVTLSATVTSTGGAVNEGTVTFKVLNGGTAVGTATTSGTLTNGAASVSYQLPAGTLVGTYTIQAVYNPLVSGNSFLTSSDSTHTLAVSQTGAPVTTWPSASPITYGQTLGSSTLNGGSSPVPGTFSWTTPSTVPNAGTPSESVTFTPTDTSDYAPVTGTVVVTVNKATPSITTWPTASPITYGQTLASSTLSGGSSTPAGTFTWTTPSTAPGAGVQAESVTFTPTDSNDYNTVTGSVNVTVNKATPSVTTWPTASSITYGESLASSTLTGGAASVGGTFAWTTPTMTPGAGRPLEPVTFTPTDTTDYNTVSGSIHVTVDKAASSVTTWPTASSITYGQTLASSTLSGGAATPAGTFAWTTPSTAPNAGTPSESVTFTPTDSTDYTTVVGSVTVTVDKATPSVTAWPTASAITYGQTLASSTLSGGTASTTGAFAWTTPSTAPGVGTPSEPVTFTPADTADYNVVNGSVMVTVNKATPSVTSWPTASTITYGQTLSSSTLTGGAASTGGTFTWTSPSTTPGAGTQSENVIFSPSDSTDYTTVTGQVNVTVSKATASVTTWPIASAITYGQSLSLSRLTGGSANVSGTFAWTSPTTTPATGTSSQPVTFTPSDTADYSNISGSAGVTVGKATPTVNAWPTASSIVYGESLSSSGLSGGSANVGGTFTWTAPATTPNVGTPSEPVLFTPTDTTDYTTVTGATTVTVTSSTATVTTWPTATAIMYGQTLASSVLTGGAASVAGVFSWTAPSTAPSVGAQAESVTFTPNDTTDYPKVTGSATVTVGKATPTIVWAAPSAINYGTVLSPAVLDATASFKGVTVPGTFTYQPAAGAMLQAGTQSLTATFVPADSTDLGSAQSAVSIVVNPAVLTLVANNVSRTYGSANPVFTGSIVGAINGDVFTESFGTTATQASSAGTYSIIPAVSGSNLASYTSVLQQGTLTITTAGTSVSLAGELQGNSMALTATVSSSTSGVPTGMIVFYDGTSALASITVDGTGTAVWNGQLVPGTHSLVASYGGDSNFAPSVSSNLPESVGGTPASIAVFPNNITVNPGGQALAQVTYSPPTGIVGTLSFACTNLPQNAGCTFNPPTVSVDGSNQAVVVGMTINTQTTLQVDARPGSVWSDRDSASSLVRAGMAWWPALLLGGFVAWRGKKLRKRIRQGLCVLLLVMFIGAVTGCNQLQFGPQPPISSVKVVATLTPSSGGSAPISATLTLNQQ